MLKQYSFFICSLCLLLLYMSFFVITHSFVQAATTHIVISQIQTAGSTRTNKAHQEFVELYNPTDDAVDLTGWRLAKKTATGSAVTTLVSSMSGVMNPHAYFLVADPLYTSSSVTPDSVYSTNTGSIADNNTVILFSDNGKTRVDTVGMGTALDSETTDASNPAADQSIVRKASVNSTAATLLPGGPEEYAGNGYDSDNNANDFVLFTSAMPRNSTTPAATPIISPTPTSTLTPTVSQTVTPTNTPTSTLTPSATLPPTVTLTPSPMPSPTPVLTVTKIPSPATTSTPSPRISLTPIVPRVSFPRLVCAWKIRGIAIYRTHITIPYFYCAFVRMKLDFHLKPFRI